MNRTLLYSVILVALFGIDAALNSGSMRRDLTSALVHVGKTTHSVVAATTEFMVGKR
jgi:hypothetical protein